MVKINYENIVANLGYLEAKYHKKAFFIIKNNAYNTGISATVKACCKAGFTHFALTTMKEALLAKEADSNAYVLVMNPTSTEEILLAKKYGIALSITSYQWYLDHIKELDGVSLHLKINIGMNRFGLTDIKEINEIINTNKNVEGLLTHFPVSDIEDLTLHNQQVENFVSIVNKIENKQQLKYIHSENSATLMLEDKRLSFCNYARYGIIGYGYSPTEFDPYLKPAIYLTSKVVAVNNIKKDEYLGYGTNNKLDKDTYVAVLEIGYGDGLSKLRSNLPVTINNKQYRVIVISMSHTLVEVDKTTYVGDEVEIYGDKHRIDHLLTVCDTTNSIHMASLHTEAK